MPNLLAGIFEETVRVAEESMLPLGDLDHEVAVAVVALAGWSSKGDHTAKGQGEAGNDKPEVAIGTAVPVVVHNTFVKIPLITGKGHRTVTNLSRPVPVSVSVSVSAISRHCRASSAVKPG